MAEPSGRILKAHSIRELPGRMTFNFEDLRAAAAAELARAHEEAAAMRAAAEKEVTMLRQRAHQEGHQAGLAEGLKAAQQQIDQQAQKLAASEVAQRLDTVLPALKRAAETLSRERDAWQLRWEQSAVQLGVAIAEKLVRHQIEANPSIAREMISEALRLAAGQSRVVVRLHSRDLGALGEHAADVVRSLTSCATPELIADDSISPGGCFIETQHGEVDARLESMLDQMTRELLAT